MSARAERCASASASKLQLWRPDSETAATVKIRAADGETQELELGGGQGADCVAGRAAGQQRRRITRSNGPTRGEKSSLDIRHRSRPPADLVGAAQVLIENGCQKQLDLLVESASKVGKQ